MENSIGKSTTFLLTAITYLLFATAASAQVARLPQPGYDLPDLLTTINGQKIKDTRQWSYRRKEIIEIFSSQVYGQCPARPAAMIFKVFDNDTKAFNGKATRRQVTVFF